MPLRLARGYVEEVRLLGHTTNGDGEQGEQREQEIDAAAEQRKRSTS